MYTATKLISASGGGVTDSYFLSSLKTTEFFVNSCAFDDDGNLIVCGKTLDGNSGAAWIFKYDTEGELLWKKELDGNRSDEFADVTTDSSGNIYAVGNSNSDPDVYRDPLLVKYNSDGAIQWQKKIRDNSVSYATACAVGGSYLWVAVSEGGYFVIMRVSLSSGSISKQKKLGYCRINTSSRAIAADSSDNVYITGKSNNYNAQLVMKFNSSLTKQYAKRYRYAGNDGTGICVDDSGNAYVVGEASSIGVLLKVSSSGGLTFRKHFSLGNRDSLYPRSIEVMSDGNLHVPCHYESTGFSYFKMGSVVFNTSGVAQISEEVKYSSNNINGRGAASPLGSIAWCGGGYGGGMVIKVPNEGGTTGTYGSFTYSSVTFNTKTLPTHSWEDETDINDSTTSYSTSNDTLTASNSSVNPTKYEIT